MSRLDPRPAVRRHRGDRRRRRLAGRQRRDPGRVRAARPPGPPGTPRRERRARSGPQHRAGPGRRRVRVVRRRGRLAGARLPAARRGPAPRHRAGRADRRSRPGALEQHRHPQRDAGRVPRPARRDDVHAAGPAGDAEAAAHRVEPGGTPGVPARTRAALRAGLVRGRAVQLSGADGGRADRRTRPDLPELPAAPHRRDHEDPGDRHFEVFASGTACSG